MIFILTITIGLLTIMLGILVIIINILPNRTLFEILIALLKLYYKTLFTI